jgi:hypothetical protein
MGADRESEPTTEEEREVERAADRFGAGAEEMERRSDKLGEEIETTREDWQRKRADEQVPGANAPENEEGSPEEASFPAKGGEEDDEDPDSGGSP